MAWYVPDVALCMKGHVSRRKPLAPIGEEVEVLWFDFALIFFIVFFESIFYRYPFPNLYSRAYLSKLRALQICWKWFVDDNLWILEPSSFRCMNIEFTNQLKMLEKMDAVFWLFVVFFWRHIHVWFGQLFLSSICFTHYITSFLRISRHTPTYSHPRILSSQTDQPFSNASPLCILPMSLRPQRFWSDCFKNGH